MGLASGIPRTAGGFVTNASRRTSQQHRPLKATTIGTARPEEERTDPLSETDGRSGISLRLARDLPNSSRQVTILPTHPHGDSLPSISPRWSSWPWTCRASSARGGSLRAGGDRFKPALHIAGLPKIFFGKHGRRFFNDQARPSSGPPAVPRHPCRTATGFPKHRFLFLASSMFSSCSTCLLPTRGRAAPAFSITGDDRGPCASVKPGRQARLQGGPRQRTEMQTSAHRPILQMDPETRDLS